MRAERSRRIVIPLFIAGAVLAAGCRSNQSLSNAGIERKPLATSPATTTSSEPTTTSPPVSLAPGETLPPTTAPPATTTPPTETTQAPATTVPTLLDALPKCDTTALDRASGPVDITF